MGATTQSLLGAGPVGLFLVSYLVLILLFVGTLGLGWALTPTAPLGPWPNPARYGRVFRLAWLGLLGALSGFPPFFFLAPKLALFSFIAARGSWGLVGFMGCVLVAGWYVYWQGASAILDPAGRPVGRATGLTRGGALALATALLLPLALSGLILDLWGLAQALA